MLRHGIFLYLGNVENFVNHFRNALLRGQCTHNYELLYPIFVCLRQWELSGKVFEK